jgi:hypothetical protein
MYLSVNISVSEVPKGILTGETGKGKHSRLCCNMIPIARGAQFFQTLFQALSHSLQAFHHYLNSFKPGNKYVYRMYMFCLSFAQR